MTSPLGLSEAVNLFLPPVANLSAGESPDSVLSQLLALPADDRFAPIHALKAMEPGSITLEAMQGVLRTVAVRLNEEAQSVQDRGSIDLLGVIRLSLEPPSLRPPAVLDLGRTTARARAALGAQDKRAVAAAPSVMERGGIFLVDDEADVLEIMSQILSGVGFGVFTASSGEEALERFPEVRDRVRVIVSDHDLKTGLVKGPDFIASVRAGGWHGPAIMVTGRHPDAALCTRLRALDTAYLSKPFEPDDLICKIDAFLAQSGMTAPAPGGMGVEELAAFCEALQDRLEALSGGSNGMTAKAGMHHLLSEMNRVFVSADSAGYFSACGELLARTHDQFLQSLTDPWQEALCQLLWGPYPASRESLQMALKADDRSLAIHYIKGIANFWDNIRTMVTGGVSDKRVTEFASGGLVYFGLILWEINFRRGMGRMRRVPNLHGAKNAAQAIGERVVLGQWQELAREPRRRVQDVVASLIAENKKPFAKLGLTLQPLRTEIRTDSRDPQMTIDSELSDAEMEFLRRALTEFFRNAHRHGAASRIDVEMIQDGGGVLVKISDNGVGMTEQRMVEVAHEMIEGESDSSVRSSGGWGEGIGDLFNNLPHGWRLRLQSKGGYGTTWTMWLSRLRESPAQG